MSDTQLYGFDDQELGEREQAALAYGEEDPSLYVDWCHACIKESEDATQEVRYLWDECYKAYRAKIDYSDKEDWQSKVVTGDMYAVVKQAMAIIRKSFRQPDWFTIEGTGDEDALMASFQREALKFWFDQQHSKFAIRFTDASELGFAIGQTHEMIPRWVDGVGLVWDLVPPWQVYRDPDSFPRDPQSGDYWAHVEWIDLWKIKEWGKNNPNYVRLDEVTPTESMWGQEDQEKRARRKSQYHQRNEFRHSVRVVEQWGVILDKRGELLLPNARFTVAGDVLIYNPKQNPFVTRRWPGTSFSPLPDMFSFEGHGIIETSLMLWLMTCNLMSLHADDLSWRVNRMRELDRTQLEDPTDVKMQPGKLLFRGQGAKSGEPVVREVYGNSPTNETLATIQHWDQRREKSQFVEFVNQYSGLQGQRKEITGVETEIRTGQSMGIFDSIGEDIEDGAMAAINAARELILLNWTEYSEPSISRVFGDNPFAQQIAKMSIEERKELIKANCDVKVQGISALIKASELIPRLQFLMNKAENSVFGKYFKPYKLLKKSINTLGFYEPDFIMTDDEAKTVDKMEELITQLTANPGVLDQLGQVAASGGQQPVGGGPIPQEVVAPASPGIAPENGGLIQ